MPRYLVGHSCKFCLLMMKCLHSQRFSFRKQMCLLRWALKLYYPVNATHHTHIPTPSIGENLEAGKKQSIHLQQHPQYLFSTPLILNLTHIPLLI